MPFMKGPAPIRRTLKYLEKGKLVFRDRVKIVSLNFATKRDSHRGLREFSFWHLPQIQYKNPDVQIVTFRDLTPTPFVRCWLDTGEEVIMDVYNKSKEEILDHMIKILGKTIKHEEVKEKEEKFAMITNFGKGFERHCICEIPGQVPCPAVVKLPDNMRQKFRHTDKNE